MCRHHAWWWPVRKAHSKPAGAGAAGGPRAPPGPGHRGNGPSSAEHGAHPLQRGLGEAPAAEERFWGCAKGPGGPTGLQATGVPPELPRAHPPGLPLQTPGREGPPEAKYTLLRVRQASGPLSPCSAGFPPLDCTALAPAPRRAAWAHGQGGCGCAWSPFHTGNRRSHT